MNITTQSLLSYTHAEKTANVFLRSISSADTVKELHRHDFYQIMLLSRGQAHHIIDFETHDMTAGTVSVLFPRQTHVLHLSEDAEAHIIMFDSTVFCSEILSNELRDYNIDLSNKINYVPMEQNFNDLIEIKYTISTLYKELNPLTNMQIKFFIKILILKIINALPPELNKNTFTTDAVLYMDFRKKVDLLFKEERKVSYYARELNISTKKLTAVCQQYSGQTPLEIIHERLTLSLKNLFVSDNFSLKEITYNLGFSSQSALNKYIYQKFHCTPMEFKSYLEKKILSKS